MKRLYLLGSVLTLLGACQLGSGLNPAVGPEELPTSAIQFSDLPVPHAMRLLTTVNQSWSWQRGSFRVAELHYVGDLHVESLRSFLKDRLPSHGWALAQEDRPTTERVSQRWLSETGTGVQYLLDASLRAEGSATALTYRLSTRRAWKKASEPARATEPPAPKK